MADHQEMRSAMRRAQIHDAYDLVIGLAGLKELSVYPEIQKRLLGLAYLLDAISDEIVGKND